MSSAAEQSRTLAAGVDARERAEYFAATLALYRDSLAGSSGALYEFSFAALDRLDLPLWSVALIGGDGALADGFGYGATLDQAKTSAWGETLEWHFAHESLKRIPRRTASFAELERGGVPALDPVRLNLEAGTTYTPATPLQWVEAVRHPSGEGVLVPVEFVAPRRLDIGADVRAEDLISVPITNGLGAGPTLAHAISQGVLEVLQRDGNSVNYRALDRGIRIELDNVRDSETRALLTHLDEQGIEVIPKLATTDFGITNLYVVGFDRDPERALQTITLSACGEAAHPDREVALAKALREFTSSRARKAFVHGSLDHVRAVAPAGYLAAFRPTSLRDEDDKAFAAMQAWLRMDRAQYLSMLRERVLHVASSIRFSELPTVAPEQVTDSDALLDMLTERFAAEGFEILYVDLTPAGLVDGGGARIVRALVPGLEVETMTYNRIGKRNLRRLLECGSPLVGIGDAPANAKLIALTPEHAREFDGAPWFDPSAREQAIGNLYALYREPRRHVIGFAEERENNGRS